jgi:hypothetical protein
LDENGIGGGLVKMLHENSFGAARWSMQV